MLGRMPRRAGRSCRRTSCGSRASRSSGLIRCAAPAPPPRTRCSPTQSGSAPPPGAPLTRRSDRQADDPAFDEPRVRKAFTRQSKQVWRVRARSGRAAAGARRGARGRAGRAWRSPRSLPRSTRRMRAGGRRRPRSTPRSAMTSRGRALRSGGCTRASGSRRPCSTRASRFEGIRQLVAAEGPRNWRARQRERLAVMYAQRFCAKNDSHSFWVGLSASAT